MAEEFLKKFGGERFEAESAGIEPGKLNPIVIEVLKEEGIDISGKSTRSALELMRSGARYDHVITVCDETAAERCPVFPGAARRLHWGFPDPSAFTGTHEEKLAKTRVVRDEIKKKILEWLKEESLS